MGIAAVAVGTPVARRPPHRSVRAVLPHTAPTLDDGGQPLLGPGVQDTGGWEPPLDDLGHPLPVEPGLLAPTAEGPVPVPGNLRTEGGDSRPVARNGVVPEVAPHDGPQPQT